MLKHSSPPLRRFFRVFIFVLTAAPCVALFHFLPLSRELNRPDGTSGVSRTTKAHAVVTGGAGFIGSHCVAELLRHGYFVTVIDNLSRGSTAAITALQGLGGTGRLRIAICDLGRIDDVRRAFRNSQLSIDVVFHFAAVAHVSESVDYPLKYYLNNTANTYNLLRVMDELDVRNLVYSSTCATYGNVERLPITETTPTRPINPYGKSKLFAEEAIRDYASSNTRFQAVILRYFNVVGSDPEGRLGEIPRPELQSNKRVSFACFDAAMGIEPFKVLGTKYPTRDGTAIRDFVHVSDLVNAHIAMMDKKKWANPPSLYNIGTGVGVSMREFVDACQIATGKTVQVLYQETPRPGDNAAVFANVDKIRNDLDWVAQFTNLSESLAHAWRFQQKSVYRAFA